MTICSHDQEALHSDSCRREARPLLVELGGSPMWGIAHPIQPDWLIMQGYGQFVQTDREVNVDGFSVIVTHWSRGSVPLFKKATYAAIPG